MISIKTFVFNPFQENTYILYDGKNECIIVDPGCYEEREKKELAEWISSHHLSPVHLINTHCHVDHILGNKFVAETFGLDVEAHRDEIFQLEHMVEHAALFGFEIEKPPAIKCYLEEGSLIEFGDSSMKVLHLPGHSPGGIGLYNEVQKVAIVGDVLFKGSIGRTDLPGGSYDTLINSIQQKLLMLDHDVEVLPGHGPATTIGIEKLSNPFLS